MRAQNNHVISAINNSPLNRGLDGAVWLENPENVPIGFGDGDVILFDAMGENTYQLHYCLTHAKGREAIERVRLAFREMFEEYKASLIFGLTPVFLRHALIFNRLVGGKSAGIRETPNGPCEMFVLSREMWKAN